VKAGMVAEPGIRWRPAPGGGVGVGFGGGFSSSSCWFFFLSLPRSPPYA
jgi:hypothetical protein